MSLNNPKSELRIFEISLNNPKSELIQISQISFNKAISFHKFLYGIKDLNKLK